MKKLLLLILLLFLSNSIQAAWFTSFEEAQKEALISNKLILVDFTAKWCGPCREMDIKSWNDIEVQNVIQNYVPLKIDVDRHTDFAVKYQTKVIPYMVIMDANGKVLHRFSGYQTPTKLKNELSQFSLSTEYLTTELSNFYASKKYTTAIRTAQKYYTYSLLVNKNIKGKIIQVGSDYLKDAKEELKKSEEDYLEKKQKLELLALYEIVYQFDFRKLDKKISAVKPEKINKQNEYQYWFLRYLADKGNQKDVSKTEDFLKTNDLESVITNSNQVYAFYEKSLIKL